MMVLTFAALDSGGKIDNWILGGVDLQLRFQAKSAACILQIVGVCVRIRAEADVDDGNGGDGNGDDGNGDDGNGDDGNGDDGNGDDGNGDDDDGDGVSDGDQCTRCT